MQLFLITFAVLILAVLAMAVGVIFGRKSLKGSCGGLNTIEGLESTCPACSGTCEEKARGGSRATSASAGEA